jgi:hypothetical protein
MSAPSVIFIRVCFTGFPENLADLSRKKESNNIITKLYFLSGYKPIISGLTGSLVSFTIQAIRA